MHSWRYESADESPLVFGRISPWSNPHDICNELAINVRIRGEMGVMDAVVVAFVAVVALDKDGGRDGLDNNPICNRVPREDSMNPLMADVDLQRSSAVNNHEPCDGNGAPSEPAVKDDREGEAEPEG
jgi:hypothetical protein